MHNGTVKYTRIIIIIVMRVTVCDFGTFGFLLIMRSLL